MEDAFGTDSSADEASIPTSKIQKEVADKSLTDVELEIRTQQFGEPSAKRAKLEEDTSHWKEPQQVESEPTTPIRPNAQRMSSFDEGKKKEGQKRGRPPKGTTRKRSLDEDETKVGTALRVS